MISDLDVYRTATLIVKQHDDEAPIHAAMLADELMAAGDMEGRAVWLRVLDAVKVPLVMESDGAVH